MSPWPVLELKNSQRLWLYSPRAEAVNAYARVKSFSRMPSILPSRSGARTRSDSISRCFSILTRGDTTPALSCCDVPAIQIEIKLREINVCWMMIRRIEPNHHPSEVKARHPHVKAAKDQNYKQELYFIHVYGVAGLCVSWPQVELYFNPLSKQVMAGIMGVSRWYLHQSIAMGVSRWVHPSENQGNAFPPPCGIMWSTCGTASADFLQRVLLETF
ncbi:hypothetical protein EDD18DRAFT_1110278 [Armillaria luteobubalina]|uniref:Uncharacterized protein n=1 Tax=Armillaria luteobubalina TaxID=153913 RepID=A0AA39PS91_9AGAR|nr:hypothetical protein EDD18DRAFT_1110278 [Armillaria luteobubalina]